MNSSRRIVKLTWPQVYAGAKAISETLDLANTTMVWGVPRGGNYVAALLKGMCPELAVVRDPTSATIAVDDVISSGTTQARVLKEYNIPMLALVHKVPNTTPWEGLPYVGPEDWVQFPWEEEAGFLNDGVTLATRLIEWLGEDPNRPGLQDTPRRVAEAWLERCSGYAVTAPAELLKTFPHTQFTGRITLEAIQFNSTCEHHLLPFAGEVYISYTPRKQHGVIGLSKFCRLVQALASRLQIQERLTQQIGQAVASVGDNVFVEVRGQHACVTLRGAKDHAVNMVTKWKSR